MSQKSNRLTIVLFYLVYIGHFVFHGSLIYCTAMQKKLVCSFFLIIAFLVSLDARALKAHPYGGSFNKQMDEMFIDSGSKNTNLSGPKIQAYGEKLERIREEVVGPRSGITDTTPSVLASKYRREGESGKKLIKKVLEHKLTRLIDLSIEHFELALNAKSADEARLELGESLSLLYSVRIDGLPILPIIALGYAKSLVGPWEFKKKVAPHAEATNLVDPTTGLYLSEEDIQSLLARGGDLSRMNPPTQTSFWRNMGDIKKLDMQAVARGEAHPMYKGLGFQFPESNEFKFEEVIKSQSKPKLALTGIDKNGNKIKYKLKVGYEMHSDPTAAVLMQAAGFPADLTQYRRLVRVQLGKKTYADLVKDWESYYLRDYAHRGSRIEEFVADKGVDNKGEEYVIFKEGVLEPRVEGIDKVGPWAFRDFSYARDARGLILFQIWIANLDMKEMDNNRMALREKSDGSADVFRMVSDPGASFGNFGAFFMEKPELFPDKIVKKNTSRAVELNFLAGQAPEIREHLTYHDGRWAARLIAQFTRGQIAEAVAIGGWPECVQKVLTEKLVRRRNDLVLAFDLTSEFGIMSSEKTIDDKWVENCVSQPVVAENFVTDFDFDLDDILKPASRAAWTGVLSAARAAVGSFQKITVTGSELGIEKSLVSFVIFNAKREIEENPHQTSFEDKYLVKDSLMVGFRLGAAFGVFADSEVHREFKLVYPARSLSDARMQNGFIVNLLLLRDIRHGDLPKNYVLSTDHYMNFRAGLRLDNYGQIVSPGVELGLQRVHLWRSVFDYKNPEKPLLLREKSEGAETFLRGYLRLIFFKLTIFDSVMGWGDSSGYGYDLSSQDLSKEDIRLALHQAMVDGDFKSIDQLQKSFSFTNNFKKSEFDVGAVVYSHRKRAYTDQIQVRDNEDNTTVHNQFSEFNRSGWSLFFTGEHRERRMRVFAETDEAGKTQYSLDSTFVMDDRNTRSDELENVYLRNLNATSRSNLPLIHFSPLLGYSRNGLWGHTLSFVNLRIYNDGLKNLLQTKNETFWQTLTVQLGKTRTQLDEELSAFLTYKERQNPSSSAYRSRHGLSMDDIRFYRALLQFIDALNKAKSAKTEVSRIESLARALKAAFYNERNNGINTEVVSFMLNLIQVDDYYLEVGVTTPEDREKNFIEEVDLWGAEGNKKKLKARYLIHSVDEPSDLYFMLDNWF